jgi:hypothetical protein
VLKIQWLIGTGTFWNFTESHPSPSVLPKK